MLPHTQKSVRKSNALVHLQVMETRKSWTWRRRVLSIFSRNCSRWTEELPPLRCLQKRRPNLRQRLPYQRQAPYQYPHRQVIYVRMYFTLLSTIFPTLGVRLRHFVVSPRDHTSWNELFQRLSSGGRFIKESYVEYAIMGYIGNIVQIVYKLN